MIIKLIIASIHLFDFLCAATPRYQVREFRGHNARVLHMSLSPDGTTIVSAGADESIRFWEIFGGSTKADFKANLQVRGAYGSPNQGLSCGFSLR